MIAAAIDLRVTAAGEVSEGDFLHIELPDMNKTLEFASSGIRYDGTGDYLKSVVKVLKEENLYRPRSIRAVVTGNVPIRAGTSSSAAFSVAWTGFLLRASGEDISRYPADAAAVAELAYRAEVAEFNESGGRMDQYASAMGGIVYLDFYKGMAVESLPMVMKEFVLGDSLEPKDTQRTLKRVRTAQEEAFGELSAYMEFTDNFHVTYKEAEPFLNRISSERRPFLRAALMNHDITDRAKEELLKESPDINRLSDLMNAHHGHLRDDLKVSTQKIERMIDKSLGAGALAAKINGSGEGGCMFAFCPGKQEAVAEAIAAAGGTPYIINIGKGLETVAY